MSVDGKVNSSVCPVTPLLNYERHSTQILIQRFNTQTTLTFTDTQTKTWNYTPVCKCFTQAADTHQSTRPLSRRLFLVSLVISGAAGQGVWLTLPSEDPPPTPGFSCDSAFSSRDGVWLSLGSDSAAPPTGPSAPPSSRGSRLWQKM